MANTDVAIEQAATIAQRCADAITLATTVDLFTRDVKARLAADGTTIDRADLDRVIARAIAERRRRGAK